MTHVIDAGGRYHWIDKEFEDISVGDEFVIQTIERWDREDKYSDVKKVTRFTDLTVWIKGDDDEKETRVSRTNGKPHGSRWSSRYAKPLTAELKMRSNNLRLGRPAQRTKRRRKPTLWKSHNARSMARPRSKTKTCKLHSHRFAIWLRHTTSS